MKKIVILLLTLVLLVTCGIWEGSAALRERVEFQRANLVLEPSGSSGEITVKYADNQQVAEVNGLPAQIRRFVVKSGEFDSVSAVGVGMSLVAEAISIAIDPKTSTFAGDSERDNDYYRRELEKCGALIQPTAVVTVVDQSVVDEREIITLMIQPLEYDQVNRRLLAYTGTELNFHGSPDLVMEPISDSEISVNPLQRPALKQSSSLNSADYLIVTATQFIPAFDEFIKWKTAQGHSVEIAFMADIIGSNSGRDDAEKLRNFLIGKYSAGVKYVLLAGDETIIPIRYAYHANTSAEPTIDMMNICDLYYGDVNGNWDADGDGVYGEPSQDQPDLSAEMLVGRLPFHQLAQFQAYSEKLIKYEQNPGNGSYDYLKRALFISADQMRDYQTVGQHTLLAAAYPGYVSSDVSDIVEAPTGDAENPPTPMAGSAIQTMSSGWGMMTLLIHEVSDGWVLRSNEYNLWPKSFLFTASGTDGDHGFLPNIQSNNKPGVIYSIGCDNAAFDMDAPPFASTNPCVAESFLSKPAGGAVCFVGYSRWGWVASSWRLEEAFINYLYNQHNNAAEAMNHSKLQYSYYRDLCYGLNYFGDPSLAVWTDAPQSAQIAADKITDTGLVAITATITDGDTPIAGALVTVLQNNEIIAQTQSNGDGSVNLSLDFNIRDDFELIAYKSGHAVAKVTLAPEIALDVDDETGGALPESYAIYQNFPNPFNPETTIRFDVPQAAEVAVEIFNVLGQRVKTLFAGDISAGSHAVDWNGSDNFGRTVSSGVYFARISAPGYARAIKMSLLK